jgi:alkylated DNA repair protein alkB family protein 8
MIVSRTTDTVDGEVIPRTLRVSLTLRTALTAPIEGEQATPLSRFESKIFPPYWGQPCDTQAVVDVNKSAVIERSDLITPATESKHVHAVYDAIATQWHHTRGKRGVLWPGATQFLENLPPGSIVADVGCGDGKYFSAILGANSYVIGTDISEALLRTASSAEKSGDNNAKIVSGPQYQRLSDDKRALSAFPAVAVADCIHLPIRSGSCDAAICIAVMHHLSTVGRRIRCLTELARVVKVGGLINVQAWALEQEGDSKRKFDGSDILVPFNAQPKFLQAPFAKTDDNTSNCDSAGDGKGVAQMISESYDGAEFDSKKNLVIFQRYCHMYRRGELEELVAQIPCLELIESAYEKGNHVVLLKVCPSGMG